MNAEDLPFQPKEIQRFLNLLGYNPTEPIYLRAIKPSEAQKIQAKDIASIPIKKLEVLQEKGFNLYLVVNGGGHKDVDIKYCRAIFYEHDNLPKDVQRDLWKNLGLPKPTVQVNTGGKSIHSYWVFDQPIEVSLWKQLQADLLEYANADRTIKNPSRVMRLPGCAHQSSQKTSTIISSSGKRYTYSCLRAVVPTPSVTLSTLPSVASKAVISPSVTPASVAASVAATSVAERGQWIPPIPLENCLTKEHRDFVAYGISQGGRNEAGAALARDLIGTAARLKYLGIEHSSDPIALFEEFCSVVSGNSEAIAQLKTDLADLEKPAA